MSEEERKLIELQKRMEEAQQQERLLIEAISPREERWTPPGDIASYLDGDFKNDCKKHGEQGVSTGFSCLDQHMKLYPGIMLLGGMPGAGKTSLALQIANNFAAAGRKTAYVSLEQTKRALTAKSISCFLKDQGRDVAWTDIGNGSVSWTTLKAPLSRYKDTIGRNLSICYYSQATPLTIGRIISAIKKESDTGPAVIVDYVQLLKPWRSNTDMSFSTSQRQILEDAVCQLLAVQKQYDCIMIGICSLSREGYGSEGKRPSMATLKETGLLEYSADKILLLYRNKENQHLTLECVKDKEGAGSWEQLLVLEGTYSFFKPYGIGKIRNK